MDGGYSWCLLIKVNAVCNALDIRVLYTNTRTILATYLWKPIKRGKPEKKFLIYVLH